MRFPQDEIDALKVFGAISILTDGGQEHVLISNCRLPAGCNPSQMDVLLCPYARDGYPSRLLFAARPQGRIQPNWRPTVRVADRTWENFSFNNVRADLPLLAMLTNHLGGLA